MSNYQSEQTKPLETETPFSLVEIYGDPHRSSVY